jgi:hypothetical protein
MRSLRFRMTGGRVAGGRVLGPLRLVAGAYTPTSDEARLLQGFYIPVRIRLRDPPYQSRAIGGSQLSLCLTWSGYASERSYVQKLEIPESPYQRTHDELTSVQQQLPLLTPIAIISVPLFHIPKSIQHVVVCLFYPSDRSSE